MRLELLAAVIAGLLAAAPAQAQTAGVVLYGRVNLNMEVVNGKQPGAGCPDRCPNPNLFRVSSNSSMFGLRGSEPVGAGTSAIFQIESNVQVDTGGGVLASRESFIGLQGPWGTFKLGNFLSPYDDILPIFGNAPTLTSSILSTAALWAQGFLGPPSAGGFDARIHNSVRYDTPALSGASGSVQFGTAEGTPTDHSYVLSVGGFYNNGPLQLGTVYQLHNKIRGTAAAPLTDTALSIAGGYQFESFRLGGVYERLRYDVTPSTDLKRDFWGVSATIDAGPGLIYAFVGRAGDGTGSAVNGSRIGGLTKGASTGSTQWEVSYTYVVSARTLFYAGYVRIENESNAAYTFNINLYPILCDRYPNGACGKPAGFLVGAAHFF